MSEREDYWTFINCGPHPDESDTWVEGDILEWGGGGMPNYTVRLRFVRLDPDDPIGFYASEIRGDGAETGVSAGWSRGRFIRAEQERAPGVPDAAADDELTRGAAPTADTAAAALAALAARVKREHPKHDDWWCECGLPLLANEVCPVVSCTMGAIGALGFAAPATLGYVCGICGRHIEKEAHGGPRPSAGDHDSGAHVLQTYGDHA